MPDCWFDDPLPDDRWSWAVPPGHGTYQGLDLERLDPDDEDQRTFLLEAQHLEMEEALEQHEEMTGPGGEPVNPRLHVTMHLAAAGGTRPVLTQALECRPSDVANLLVSDAVRRSARPGRWSR